MFLVVTQWMPLRPTADRFDGCFCLGSGPVFGVSWCSFAFALIPLAKRKSGWGICGSSLFVWLCFSLFVLIDLLISRTYVLVQCFSCLLSCKDRALARHRPISRKKHNQKQKKPKNKKTHNHTQTKKQTKHREVGSLPAIVFFVVGARCLSAGRT